MKQNRKKINVLKFSLRRREKLSSTLSNCLKVKKILKLLGGKFRQSQLKNLLKSVKTKNRLVSIFESIFLRLDFFLVLINLARTGNEARQLIKQKRIGISCSASRKNVSIQGMNRGNGTHQRSQKPSTSVVSWIPTSYYIKLKQGDTVSFLRKPTSFIESTKMSGNPTKLSNSRFSSTRSARQLQRLLPMARVKKNWLRIFGKKRANVSILCSHHKTLFHKWRLQQNLFFSRHFFMANPRLVSSVMMFLTTNRKTSQQIRAFLKRKNARGGKPTQTHKEFITQLKGDLMEKLYYPEHIVAFLTKLRNQVDEYLQDIGPDSGEENEFFYHLGNSFIQMKAVLSLQRFRVQETQGRFSPRKTFSKKKNAFLSHLPADVFRKGRVPKYYISPNLQQLTHWTWFYRKRKMFVNSSRLLETLYWQRIRFFSFLYYAFRVNKVRILKRPTSVTVHSFHRFNLKSLVGVINQL